MTEDKRYSYNHLGVIFDNTRYDVTAMSVKEIVESLNRLSDENEELKNSNHTLAQNLIKSLDMRIRLEKENKQLKYNYNEKCNEYCGLEEQVDILLKENEQLKSFKSRIFNLLQDEIRKESELLDYYLNEKAPCNADRQQIIIGVLKRLQKELEE